jgi:RNA-binding protein
VIVGNNGLSNTVNQEIDRALYDHELIKMRVNSEDREERRAIFLEICEKHQAELVQSVGKMGVLYRKSDKQ